MNDSMSNTFFKRVVATSWWKISFTIQVMIATVDNKCLYPNYKLVSQYFCYLNVCNTEIMMCGWKDCMCCSFWISSMKADLNVFNTCFTSRVSVELEQRMFCCHPYQWMTAFTSEAWWCPILWFINMGSYKTYFSCSIDTRDVVFKAPFTPKTITIKITILASTLANNIVCLF